MNEKVKDETNKDMFKKIKKGAQEILNIIREAPHREERQERKID